MYARDRPSAGIDATEHDLAVVAHEPRVDAGFGGTRADDDRVGPPTDDQVEGLDEHRLAGAGFAADRCQPVVMTRSTASMTPRFSMCNSLSTSHHHARRVEVPSGSC